MTAPFSFDMIFHHDMADIVSEQKINKK